MAGKKDMMMIIVCGMILILGVIHKSEGNTECIGECMGSPGPMSCLSQPGIRSFRAPPCSFNCFKSHGIGKYKNHVKSNLLIILLVSKMTSFFLFSFKSHQISCRFAK